MAHPSSSLFRSPFPEVDEEFWDVLPDYKYRPLSPGRTIRVLQVEHNPGFPTLPVVCGFAEASVEGETSPRFGVLGLPPNRADLNAIPYMALSYTWDDQEKDVALMIINEDNDFCKIYVTPNVRDALSRLHKWTFRDDPFRVFWIWIDAVCIDQSNNSERAEQVAMMDRIYQWALWVPVWLGRGDERSDKIMHKLHLWSVSTGNYTLKRWLWNRLYKDLIPKDELLLFLDGSSYWTRIWTIQELAFAKHSLLFCGNADPISLNVIADARENHGGGNFARKSTVHYMFRPDSPWGPVYVVLQQKMQLPKMALAMSLKALNPSDKIYAIRNLGIEALRQVPIDYARPAEEIYRLATKAIIEDHQNFKLWVYSESAMQHEFAPSWAVDFGNAEAFSRSTDNSRMITTYLRSEGSKPVFRFENDGWHLRLSGYKLDVLGVCFKGHAMQHKDLAEAGPSTGFLEYTKSQKSIDDLDMFCRWYHESQDFSGGSPRDFVDKWVKFLANAFPQDMDYSQAIGSWLEFLSGGLDWGSARNIEQLWHDRADSLALLFTSWAIFQFLERRVVFLSRAFLWLGLSTGFPQCGDVLVTTAGSQLPLVLRQSPNGLWRLVGFAIIGGNDLDTMGGAGKDPREMAELEDFVIE